MAHSELITDNIVEQTIDAQLTTNDELSEGLRILTITLDESRQLIDKIETRILMREIAVWPVNPFGTIWVTNIEGNGCILSRLGITGRQSTDKRVFSVEDGTDVSKSLEDRFNEQQLY